MSADVEIVTVNPEFPACEKPADLPVAVEGPVAANVGGVVTVCGGITRGSGGITRACQELVGGSWRKAAFSLNAKRMGASGVVLSNGTWMVTGGRWSSADSQDFLLADGRFHRGPPLPANLDVHCMVPVNETHVFVADGGR